MSLIAHELIHLSLSLLSGYLAWQISGNPYTFAFGLIGGFFVDVDHLIDYFLAFKFKWNLSYFLKGYQFLKSDKIYVFFHSWELSITLLLISIYFVLNSTSFTDLTSSTNLTGFALAYFFHLLFDSLINHLRPLSYFLIYRAFHNFNLKNLVTSKHYQEHLLQKRLVTFPSN